MTERLGREKAPETSHEKAKQHEVSREQHEAARRHEAAVRKHEEQPKADLEHIRQKAKQEATDKKSIELETDDKSYKPTQTLVNKELKSMAYHRLLGRAQRHLKPGERVMSKIMHQPVVEAVSETAAKSIARPSGILGGGIAAFTGTAIYYYITKYYGYDYNFFVFILLLVGGFIAGWIIELSIKLLRRRPKH